jgi:hypothetical protein
VIDATFRAVLTALGDPRIRVSGTGGLSETVTTIDICLEGCQMQLIVYSAWSPCHRTGLVC